jgi:hypothetical protein
MTDEDVYIVVYWSHSYESSHHENVAVFHYENDAYEHVAMLEKKIKEGYVKFKEHRNETDKILEPYYKRIRAHDFLNNEETKEFGEIRQKRWDIEQKIIKEYPYSIDESDDSGFEVERHELNYGK